MTALLHSEFRKFFSTRMWWVLLLVMVGYLAFIGAAIAFSFSAAATAASSGSELPPVQGLDAAKLAYSVTSPMGYGFALIIGSMIFTSEFRHKTITSTLLYAPRRTQLLLGKLLVGAAVGLLIGVAAVAGTALGAVPVLEFVGDGAYLGSVQTWSLWGWAALVMMLWTVVGVAVGGLLANQVAAIVVIIGFTQFVEPIARVATGAVSWLSGVGAYLPGAAADAVLGTSFFGSIGQTDLLPRWGGVLVMLAYIAIFAVGARFVTLRRDVT